MRNNRELKNIFEKMSDDQLRPFVNYYNKINGDVENKTCNGILKYLTQDDKANKENKMINGKVRVKTLEKMKKEYPIGVNGVITGRDSFTDKMEQSLPKDRIIFVKDNIWETKDHYYNITEEMIDRAFSGKQDFDKYEFKGEFNLDLLINDQFRDKRRSFVVIGPNNAIICMLRNFSEYVDGSCNNIEYKNGCFIDSDRPDDRTSSNEPYFFKIVDKKDVHEWTKYLKDENKRYNKIILKEKDKISKSVKNKTNAGDRFKVLSI